MVITKDISKNIHKMKRENKKFTIKNLNTKGDSNEGNRLKRYNIQKTNSKMAEISSL